jgi:hypothetical protein
MTDAHHLHPVLTHTPSQRHLWAGFRTIQQAQALPSEEPYASLLLETLNLLIEDSREAADFWFKVIL